MTDYFGNRDITLQDIKPKHIQDFYSHLLEEGLSGNTVKHYHANIRKALQYAMRTDIIPSNPADKVELPKIQKYNPSFYSSDEVKVLLSEVVGTKLEIPVMIDCFYDFRRSEVIGLKWSAIDFEKKTKTNSFSRFKTYLCKYSNKKWCKYERNTNLAWSFYL